MAFYHVGGTCDVTFDAEADLRLLRYHIIKHGSAANGVTVATANSEFLVGVLQNTPNINEEAVVRISGPSKCVCDGSTDIVAGNFITSDNSGHGVQQLAADGDQVRYVVGRALEPYADSTPVPIEILVNCVAVEASA